MPRSRGCRCGRGHRSAERQTLCFENGYDSRGVGKRLVLQLGGKGGFVQKPCCARQKNSSPSLFSRRPISQSAHFVNLSSCHQRAATAVGVVPLSPLPAPMSCPSRARRGKFYTSESTEILERLIGHSLINTPKIPFGRFHSPS